MVRQFEKYAAQVVVFLDEVGDEREDWLTHNDGVKVRQALDTLLTACGRPAGRPAGNKRAQARPPPGEAAAQVLKSVAAAGDLPCAEELIDIICIGAEMQPKHSGVDSTASLGRPAASASAEVRRLTEVANECEAVGNARLPWLAGSTHPLGQLRNWPGNRVVPAGLEGLRVCSICHGKARRNFPMKDDEEEKTDGGKDEEEAPGDKVKAHMRGPPRTNRTSGSGGRVKMYCLLCGEANKQVRLRITHGNPEYAKIFNVVPDGRCCGTCSRKRPQLAQQWAHMAAVSAAKAAADYTFLGYSTNDTIDLPFGPAEIRSMMPFGVVDLSSATAAVAGREASISSLHSIGVPAEVATKLVADCGKFHPEHRLEVGQTSLELEELALLTSKGLLLRGRHAPHMREYADELNLQPRSKLAGHVAAGSVEGNRLRASWIDRTYVPALRAISDGARERRPNWPLPLRNLARMRYWDRCGGCRHPLNGCKGGFDLDHMAALATNGLRDQAAVNRFDNAQPLCQSCHSQKTRCDGSSGKLDTDARVVAIHMAHALGYGRGLSMFENQVTF